MNERLNHEAYEDVLDRKPPRYPENEEYMRRYRFWKSSLPMREQEEF